MNDTKENLSSASEPQLGASETVTYICVELNYSFLTPAMTEF